MDTLSSDGASLYVKYVCICIYLSAYSLIAQKLFSAKYAFCSLALDSLYQFQLNALIFLYALKKRIIKEAINAISFIRKT